MPNTASLTFRLFGVDVNASRTISGVGFAAAGTARELETLAKGTAVFTAAAGAAGIASVGLAGTLGAGLGVAFAGVGIAAALMNKNVAKEFKHLGQGIKDQISAAAKPVQDAMLQLFKYVSTSIKTMGPLFHSFFAAVAPLVTIIGHGLVAAVANLVGEFTPLVKVVTPIVQELFAQLPDLIGNIAAALRLILAPLSGNTAAFGQLLSTIGSLLPIIGSIIGSLVRLGQQIMPVFSRALLAVGTALDTGLARLLPVVGRALNQLLPPLAQLVGVLLKSLATVLGAAVPVFGRFVALLATGLAKVLPNVVPAFLTLIGAVNQLLPALVPLIPPIAVLVKGVSNLIPPLAELAAKLVVALTPALTLAVKGITALASWLGTRLGQAVALISPPLTRIATFLSGALSGAVKAVTDKLTTFKNIFDVLGPKAALKSLFPASMAGTVGKIADAVGGIATKLSTFGTAAAGAAKGWAGKILAGINDGLKTGHWGVLAATAALGLQSGIGNGAALIGTAFAKVDWRRVGGTLSDGFVKLIEGIGNLGKAAVALGKLIISLAGKVDWFSVGTAVGKEAAPFLIAFAGALLDPAKLWAALRKHPFDFVAGLLSILGIGKIGGKIAEVLGHIPFLKVFAPLFDGLHSLTKPVNDAIGRIVGLFGEGFRAGFRRVFPKTAADTVGRLKGWLDLAKTAVGVKALELADAMGRLVKGLGTAVGKGTGLVVKAVRDLIAAMVRPFARAAEWLTRPGREAVGGLWDGLKGKWPEARAWLDGIPGRVKGIFSGALRWLTGPGREVLQGLWNGLLSKWEDVKRWFGGIPGWIKAHKGPISLDRRLLVPAGAAIMGGFLSGLKSGASSAISFVSGIAGNLWNILAGPAGGGGGGNAAIVKNLAASLYGWVGAQWNALYQLVMGESGFRNTAQNPTSSAYGMFQFLDATWGAMGGSKTSDPVRQTVLGLRYIKQAYGSPGAAWSAWSSRSPHWYGSGLPPTVFSRPTLIGVGEAGPELVSVTPPGGRGGATTVINIPVTVSGVVGDEHAVAARLTPVLRRAIREALRREGKPVTV